MYDTDYMLTHDIDWFFYAGSYLIHAASNQGILPIMIEERSNSMVQRWVNDLPELNFESDIEVNTKYIEGRLKNMDSNFSSLENYKRTFVNMAKKGLFSFDRDLSFPEKYVWIARPLKELQDFNIPVNLYIVQFKGNKQLFNFRIVNDKIEIE